MMPERKHPQSEGETYVPQYLKREGIGPGEWMTIAKSHPARIMKDPSWPDKARVWASLSLHTFSFQRLVAVKMDRGRIIPLTRSDIAAETGMDGRRVNRAIVALESEGWVERASTSGKETLQRGDIEIRVYAIPRQAEDAPPTEVQSEDSWTLPEGLSDELVRYLKRYKVRDLPGETELERAQSICHQLSELETELRKVLRHEPEGGGAKPSTVTRDTTVRGTRADRQGYARHTKSGDLIVGVKSSTENITAAAEQHSAPKSNGKVSEWPAAAAAIQRKFPRTENQFANDLAVRCRIVIENEGGDPELLTDTALADVIETAWKPQQQTAGLFLTTVPEVVRNSMRGRQ